MLLWPADLLVSVIDALTCALCYQRLAVDDADRRDGSMLIAYPVDIGPDRDSFGTGSAESDAGTSNTRFGKEEIVGQHAPFAS